VFNLKTLPEYASYFFINQFLFLKRHTTFGLSPITYFYRVLLMKVLLSITKVILSPPTSGGA